MSTGAGAPPSERRRPEPGGGREPLPPRPAGGGRGDGRPFVAAIAVAAAAAAAIAHVVRRDLEGLATDVVGYPIFWDFNVYGYLWPYWTLTAFALVALAAVVVLSRIAHAAPPPSIDDQSPAPSPAAPEYRVTRAQGWPLGSTPRMALVGTILAAEVAVATSPGPDWIFRLGLPIVLGYVATVAVAGVLLARAAGSRPLEWRISAVNAFGVALAVGGLYFVVDAARVRVPDGTVHEFGWLPWWLAFAAAALLAASIAGSLLLGGGDSTPRRIERRTLVVVAGPVALFVYFASLPGAIGRVDHFHEGELLVGATALEGGAFPWRDIMLAHGPLQDAFVPLLGFHLFEHSRWGAVAGQTALLNPLWWISLYALAAFLFRRHLWFLVATQVAVASGLLFFNIQHRFLLLPFVLLLLALLLARPTWPRAFAFTTLLAVQAIVTPEAAVVVVALAATVVGFELFHYDRGRRPATNFPRTVACAATGLGVVAAWLGFLASQRAADDFVFYYLTFLRAHELTGGIPIESPPDRIGEYVFAVLSPIVVVALALAYVGAKISWRRRVSADEWAMTGVALVVLLYYSKYVARADTHVFQVHALAIPLILYVSYRLLQAAAEVGSRLRPGTRRRDAARYATVAAVAGVVVAFTPSWLDRLRDLPMRMNVPAPAPPQLASLGFATEDALDSELVADLRDVVDRYLGPDDVLFDFTNTPALFHYFLGVRPASRYYHVSMAIRHSTQQDLIRELERVRPKLVVFWGLEGLNEWDDIPNQVRHRHVSEYLLRNYQPAVLAHDYVFMTRRDGAEPRPSDEDRELYFRTGRCEWGYSPHFLAPPSASGGGSEEGVDLPIRRLGGVVQARGWAGDVATGRPAEEVVAVLGRRVVGRARPMLTHPGVADDTGVPGWERSGFAVGAVLRAPEDLAALRIYAIGETGTAAELMYGTGSAIQPTSAAPESIVLPSGRRVQVVPGATRGWVDSAVTVSHLLELTLPAGVRPAAFSALAIEARGALPDTEFVLTGRADEAAAQGIGFRGLPRAGSEMRLQAAACSQWHGYRGDRLYLQFDADTALTRVRLLP